MASKQASKRLQKEYQMMMANPPEFIKAKPLESNILVWHYIVTGPPDSPYTGGEYHGKVIFPEEYPYKPPAIKMLTPNGRFQTDTRLCLSMSDYHPGTWNPAWSVATILTGLLSFMLEETPTTGSVKTSVPERRALAQRSKAWNRKDPRFREVWDDLLADEPEEPPVSVEQPSSQQQQQPDLRKRLPTSTSTNIASHPTTAVKNAANSQQPANAPVVVPAPNVAFVQKAMEGLWGRIRSNLWILVLGGVMMYVVVLKVISRLG
ncbi:UBC-like protein [Rhizoclosmatium globosum]|uniref:Ubiquitin-conjugating enzyme E2 6 n=1 Tax=Rhizoclosmatium globosum TaxID=329046 RepID=A0A1Y2BN16_9FUNG|nr:UBC-like protein [Rhizoclosmatium globosum]|eukprot:ORY36139.1 UBC-like protein [Rhizoclosmatium globosum]